MRRFIYIFLTLLCLLSPSLFAVPESIESVLDDDEFLEELSTLNEESELYELRKEREEQLLKEQQERELQMLLEQEERLNEEEELENLLDIEDEDFIEEDEIKNEEIDEQLKSIEEEVISEIPHKFQDKSILPNVARTREPFQFLKAQKPDIINKFFYSEENKHLPPATSIQQYTDLLFLAAIEDDVNAIKTLIARGVNINAQNKENGQSAIFYAYKSGSWRALEFLAHYGVNLNLQDSKGDTILHMAASVQNIELIKMLLEFKASPLIENNSGVTPFELLSDNSKLHLSSMIAKYPDLSNEMVILFIKENKHRLLREILHDNKDLNFMSRSGETPLTLASKLDNIKLIKILLYAGANPKFKNKKGLSPYDIASRMGKKRQLQLYKTVELRNQLDLG